MQHESNRHPWVLPAAVAVALVAGHSAVAGPATPQEDETVMARARGVTLQRAIAAATDRVPGRVTWAARERFDGSTFVMVQVVKDDRTTDTVTLDSRSGKVLKVEPHVDNPKKGDDKKKDEKGKNGTPAVHGTIPAGNARPYEYPYLAKVSMLDAITAALAWKKGAVVEVYLYAEAGWVLYGIEISTAVGKIEIVQVDAGTGRVLGTVRM